MRILKPTSLVVLALAVLPSNGQASPTDYCAAYARDFADAGPRDEGAWQHRFENAEKACLFQYSADQPSAPIEPALEVPAQPKPTLKPKAKVQMASKATAPEESEPADVAPPQENAPAPKKLALQRGSDAWNDYCTRKYVSFKKETGTYMSKTGVERKCLVTSDFR